MNKLIGKEVTIYSCEALFGSSCIWKGVATGTSGTTPGLCLTWRNVYKTQMYLMVATSKQNKENRADTKTHVSKPDHKSVPRYQRRNNLANDDD